MVTRVVAKQGKTTKAKTNLLMEKKSSKEYSVVFLAEGEKFNLGEKKSDKVQAKSSNLPCRFCCELGRHTACVRSGFDAKYSRASAFCFFLSTTMVFAAVQTHFARKNISIFMLIGSLSRKNEISSKINNEV